MDAYFQSLSSLSCELRIITAKNIEMKATRNLFVRCYLSAGNNQRVKLDSQEISQKSSNLIWNESFSLDLFSLSKQSMNMLKEGSVVFELRSRSNTVPMFGRMGKSQLLGSGEVPWKSVIESPNMETEKWVVMIPKKGGGGGGLHEDLELPAIQIGMKIEASVAADVAAKRQRRSNGLRKWDECGCSSCHGGCQTCQDYEFFALGVALEGF